MFNFRIVALGWVGAAVMACGGGGNTDAVDDDTTTDADDDGALPATVTETIGATGGSIAADGITLQIPPGALATDTEITLRPTAHEPTGGYTIASDVYRLEPEGLTFEQPVSITIGLDAQAPEHVTLFWSKPGDVSQYDDVGGTVTGSAITASNTHFSEVFAGVGPALLVADVAAVDLGSVNLDADGPDTVITIRNAGGAASGEIATSLGGAEAVVFRIASSTCTGASLEPGATCTIAVHLRPTTFGPRSATVRAVATPGGTSSITLTGTGTGPTTIVAAPRGRLLFDFGSHTVGSNTTQVSIFNGLLGIVNTGTTASGEITVTITGPDASEFALLSDLCTGAIIPGYPPRFEGDYWSCGTDVRFAPTTPGVKSATVVFSSTRAGVVSVALAAIATATDGLRGTVPVTGESRDGATGTLEAVTITNAAGVTSGALAVSLAGADPGRFRVTSDACAGTSLAPNGSCTVGLEYLGGGPRWQTASLVVTGGAVPAASVPLTGQSSSSASVSLTPNPLAFGSHAIGSMTDLVVTLTNSGDESDDNAFPTITGPDSADFQVQSQTCDTNPNGMLYGHSHCTITLRFTPSAAGPRSATLAVCLDNPATAALSGTGL